MNLKSNLEYQAQIRRIESLIASRRFQDAQAALQQILKKRKNDERAMRLLIEATYRENRFPEALLLLKRFLKLHPKDVRTQILIGELMAHEGQVQEAISRLQSLYRKDPTNPRIIYALADAYDLNGEGDKAIDVLDPVFKADQMTPDMAWLYGTLLVQKKRASEAVSLIEHQLQQSEMDDRTQRKLLYLLGKAHESLDEIEPSYEACARANRLHETVFDEAQYAAFVDRLMEVFSPDALKGLPRSTLDSEQPVFIISRPRSGSTLVERIVGSHPDAHAAGELVVLAKMLGQLGFLIGSDLEFPECVGDLDVADLDRCAKDYLTSFGKLEKGVRRVTDKTITNVVWVGAISMLFPKAKLIDLRRNPLDTCLSCWTADLGDKFPACFNLEHLALEYKMHIRMMEHWHRVLDMPIMRVNYEDLVADQETWSRRLVDFIDLPWDDRCLRFHESDSSKQPSGSASPTLSYHQVTQPIYQTAVNRSERFGRYLDPVRVVLGLGDDERPLGHEMRY